MPRVPKTLCQGMPYSTARVRQGEFQPRDETAQRRMTGRGAEAELQTLRRKADILAMLYELTRTFNSVFDLKTIFDKATDVTFRVTPADRVVALLGDGPVGANECAKLKPVGTRTRLKGMDDSAASFAISRTILHKVIGERVALLSQDAAADAQLAHAKSIVSQGVRSTICAPLLTESGVHGVIYADGSTRPPSSRATT